MTNIMDALNILENVYDPTKYANTNVIFITDGEDTVTNNFNDRFENKIKNFKNITNHLNFYVLGIGRNFPTFISQIIRNKLHTGSSSVLPLFAALNGLTEEITNQLTSIFDHLEKHSLIEIQNDLASSLSVVTNIPRLIWVPDGFKPVDDRQKAFIAKLNEGREGVAGAELIFSSLESFKDILFDKIEVVESQLKAKEAAAAKAASASSFLFLSSISLSYIIFLSSDGLTILTVFIVSSHS
jgi:hypothetical protein